MFFQGVSSVLLLDKYGNDMLCSMLFLSLGFDVLTDYFYRRPACTEQTEALTSECFFPEFFSYLWVLFFQQSAAGTFIGIDELLSSVFGYARNITWTWSASWFHSSSTIPYPGAIYSKISFALSNISSFSIFLLYFIIVLFQYTILGDREQVFPLYYKDFFEQICSDVQHLTTWRGERILATFVKNSISHVSGICGISIPM